MAGGIQDTTPSGASAPNRQSGEHNQQRENPSGAGVNALLPQYKRNQSGGGIAQNGKAGVASKKISVQNPQKRFGLAESFGSQKIFRKNFGKLKKGFVSIGRIFGVSGKNLSGVRLFGCIYW